VLQREAPAENDESGNNFPDRPDPTSKKVLKYFLPGSRAVMAPHSSQYMIAGIKNRYEFLKTKFAALELEHTKLKQTDFVQKIEEYRVYAMVLES